MRRYFTLFILLVLTLPVYGQLKLSVEFRPRAEMQKGYGGLSSESKTPSYFISQRSRLMLNYFSESVNINLSLQDVRVWGDETNYSSTGVFGDNASVDVYEAWTELFLSKNTSFKIGRQKLFYDDEILLSTRNWNQNGIVYDAFLFKQSFDDWTLHACLSLNNDKANKFGNLYNPGKMKTLNFLYVSKEIDSNIKLSAIGMLTGFNQADSTEIIYAKGTFGGTVKYKDESINAFGSGYFQTGKNNKGREVSAYYAGLEGYYKFGFLSAGAGMKIFSGHNSASTDADYLSDDHLFDNFYGVRHSILGTMDYFNDLRKSTMGGGINDFWGRLEFAYSGKNYLRIDAHLFSLNTPVADPQKPGASLEKNLGTEIDFTLNHKFTKQIELTGGYSIMLPSESLEIINSLKSGESTTSHWIWMMLTLNVDLLD